MVIDRRAFIHGAAVVTSVPTLARLLCLSSTLPSHASPISGSVQAPRPAAGSAMNSVIFKIDGWERHDDIGVDRSERSSTNRSNDHEVLLTISQSWRTAWR